MEKEVLNDQYSSKIINSFPPTQEQLGGGKYYSQPIDGEWRQAGAGCAGRCSSRMLLLATSAGNPSVPYFSNTHSKYLLMVAG